ncbi:Lrp/AsnC family transcriptional regulator [Nocardia abscessus]|uniref:Lrp/AsnC family transcriptional regulator n=1 Tax=Nocardia abscessus TaxID=120957 RepID=UPI0024577596|nr:winged helix-turn-helix transcriptional regulator [Nocardia abscessus]
MSNAKTIDATDRAILNELTRDGKLSNVELAERVGLTPAPCLRRVKRLEDAGIIAGYRARLDPEAVGRAFWVYMSIEITMTSREVVEEFEATIAGYEEVTAVCRLYGPVDYLARVEVADSNAYERFQAEKMYTLPAVRRITSAPTMKVVKSSA